MEAEEPKVAGCFQKEIKDLKLLLDVGMRQSSKLNFVLFIPLYQLLILQQVYNAKVCIANTGVQKLNLGELGTKSSA